MSRIPVFTLSKTIKYETKIVAFYDIMGWRSKIEQAGNSRKKAAELKNIVRLFAQFKAEYEAKNRHLRMRVSTFSDNVVVSATASRRNMLVMMLILAQAQLYAARRGHYIRGGMTIGKIVHDDHVVFGPALNRAYYLESEIADVPRIVVDDEFMKAFRRKNVESSILLREKGIYFLNPWTLGLAAFAFRGLPKRAISPRGILTIVFYELLNAIEPFLGKRGRLQRKIRNRLFWLAGKVLLGLETERREVLLEDTRALGRFLAPARKGGFEVVQGVIVPRQRGRLQAFSVVRGRRGRRQV